MEQVQAVPAAAVVAPAAPGTTRVDEWIPNVTKGIKKYFALDDAKLAAFNTLLRANSALIAGGSILNFIYERYVNYWGPNDIDIYVPARNIKTFITGFLKVSANPRFNTPNGIFPATEYTSVDASLYCRSFLRRNGIRRIYTFIEKKTEEDEYIDAKNVDIMAVRNKRTPLAVVQNFDLTFCQVWYDGESVYATHPDHVRERSGVLQGDYVTTLLEGNKFLLRRMRKYRNRGYKIALDPSAPQTISSAGVVDAMTKPRLICNKNELTDEFLQYWFNHVQLMFLLRRYNRHMISEYKGQEYFIAPFSSSSDAEISQVWLPNGRVRRGQFQYRKKIKLKHIPARDYKFQADDGYDSDDLSEEQLTTLVNSQYEPRGTDLVAEPNFTLKYGRSLMYLLEGAAGIEYKVDENENEDFDPIMNYRYFQNYGLMWDELRNRIGTYVTYLQNACALPNVPGATNLMGDDGHVYHIHNHPVEGAVTRETLEGYLEGHIGDLDKDAVPCYWQPDPSDPSKNCKMPLNPITVHAIVSDEFWRRYTRKIEVPIRSGLNGTIELYNLTLTNSKKLDPMGFGMIYEKSMCPFCLQFEGRDEGCAYLKHKNEKRLPNSKSPFCQTHFLIEPLRQKYYDAAMRLQPELYGLVTLEFCVECGRPCSGHKHFNLAESDAELAFTPIAQMPNPRNPAEMVTDYGACTGGGRPELYARILAVREVYANPAFNKPLEERAAAAAAAERAARDPAYIARGRAILEKEIAERKWNNVIPAQKVYNDPAYAAAAPAPGAASDEKEPDSDDENDNNNNNAAVGGGKRHRYTYKNRKALRRKTRMQKRK